MAENAEKKKARKKRRGLGRWIRRLQRRISLNRRKFILYTILRLLVIVTLIRCILTREYENAALCVMALVLFLLPSLVEERLKIKIPTLFEWIIYLFIYASAILGEINHYYVLIPGWDTMLHTMNGFLCAAVGFSMVNLLNDSSARIDLSPKYVTLVAFCFSMTIGVIWEFIEFSMDALFLMDMQKDTIVASFGTVSLDSGDPGVLERLSHISRTTIETSSGKTYVVDGGYLDIGLLDTMKDLFVNLLGAIAFSVIGYSYVTRRTDAAVAEGFILRRESKEEQELISKVLDEDDNLSFAQAQSVETERLMHPPEQRKEVDTMKTNLVIAGWIAILLAVGGAILLYPIGAVQWNICFVIIKICMVSGLVMFLFTSHHQGGLTL
ncbi:MAG: hypothetical protein ACOX41_07700 [Anaerovoracaceae bacterium]|jgi:hypothetical protein